MPYLLGGRGLAFVTNNNNRYDKTNANKTNRGIFTIMCNQVAKIIGHRIFYWSSKCMSRLAERPAINTLADTGTTMTLTRANFRA